MFLILFLGDPTGTGTGGNSIWNQPFKDEFVQHLSHTGRGILSMANAGKDTNKSQFFITFRSCKHLDKKHTIFGKVVGGFETLDKMEKIETDSRDAPKEAIVIKQVVVYVDPFKELDEYIASERSKANEQPLQKQAQDNEETPLRKFRSGVGAFIDLAHIGNNDDADQATGGSAPQKKDRKISSKFGDFSSW
jgi:peptidyl-prolyl cis-trans isomerase-like protein 2